MGVAAPGRLPPAGAGEPTGFRPFAGELLSASLELFESDWEAEVKPSLLARPLAAVPTPVPTPLVELLLRSGGAGAGAGCASLPSA